MAKRLWRWVIIDLNPNVPLAVSEGYIVWEDDAQTLAGKLRDLIEDKSLLREIWVYPVPDAVQVLG